MLLRPLERAIATWALALVLAWPGAGRAREGGPSARFAALEAAGARFGEIRVVTEDVFDTDDPHEDHALFRAANALHVRTRPQVIERALLFRSGDPVTVRAVEETERVLRALRHVYDVDIEPVAVRDGTVDVRVTTRDSWTFYPGASANVTGGTTTGAIGVREYNLLGTGTSMSLSRFSNVDRAGTEIALANERAFGGDVSIAAGYARNDDGVRRSFAIAQPFYSLDTRRALGLAVSSDDRVDAVYASGEVASRYRRREDRAEAWAGLSTGVVDGRVRRLSIGVSAREDRFAPQAGEVAPPRLPDDETLVAPFARVEWIDDRWTRTQNLNQVGRPEFVQVGPAASVQLGYAARPLGSTRDAWLYSATASRGFEPAPRQTLLASGTLSGRIADGLPARQLAGGRLQWHVPQHERWAFYASLAADMMTRPRPLDVLTLGGDNGMRGYPLRYQSGTRRVLLTLEERLYTDLFWLRLFRVGAAAFVDVGRAWEGDVPAGGGRTGWLADAGLGLRVFVVRGAVSHVVHLDVAFPLQDAPDVRRAQFLVRTRTSF